MSDLIKRTNKARRFPTNTCPASRHAARIGEALVRGKPYPMLTEESAHCGESILSAVASLWEARTEIERLTDENGRLRADLLAGRNVVNAGLTIHTLTLERDELRRQLAEAEPMADSDSDYWLRNRQPILDAIERAGFALMSNASGFWLHPRGKTDAQVEPKREDQPLRDLLAVIHCDGGHHTEAVGLDQSIKDAQVAVSDLKKSLALGGSDAE